jgi:hypothetical protein
MKKNKISRRHHIVSKFYLEGFSNSGELIAQNDLPSLNHLILSISDATVNTDFYNVILPDGTKSDILEKGFSKIEGGASKALTHIKKGVWPISLEDKVGLSLWIALQYLRGSGPRTQQVQANAFMIRLIVGASGKLALKNHIERHENILLSDADLDAEWLDLTKPSGPDLIGDPAEHGHLILRCYSILAKLIAGGDWTLFNFNRKFLITADHPVSLIPYADHSPWEGLGFGNAAGIAIPLARQIGLVVYYQNLRGNDIKTSGTVYWSEFLNHATANEARKYIYSHPNDTKLISKIDIQSYDRDKMKTPDDLGFPDTGIMPTDMSVNPQGYIGVIGSDNKANQGISLLDLPWPILNRKEFIRPSNIG